MLVLRLNISSQEVGPRELLSLWIGAALYGAAMGCSDLRATQIIFSAIKLPLLLSAAFAISLPSFFVINSVAGVGDDFKRVLRGLIASQAAMSASLCSLAPFTVFWYVSNGDHELNLLFNAILFAIASVVGQLVLKRHYVPLVAHARIHLRLMKLWLVTYAFVGIQTAWVLRPFVGDPSRPTQFLRDDPWTNAYVWVARMVGRVVFG